MDFCPPASSLLRRRLLPRLREACEVGSWSSSSFIVSAGGGGVVVAAFPRSLAVRSFTNPSGVDGLFDGARNEDGGGPGGCRWRVGKGSVGLLRGRLDPVQAELGARRRPIWLHRLHPSRWRWCFLRLSTLSSKGLCLLHGSAMEMILRFLHLEWLWEDSWSSVFFVVLLLYLLCIFRIL